MTALALIPVSLAALALGFVLGLSVRRGDYARLVAENARLRAEAERTEDAARTLHALLEKYHRCEDVSSN
jgi:hypothetical protein